MNDETETFRSLRGEVGLFPNGVAPSSGGNLVGAHRNLTSSGRNLSDPTKVKP